MGLQRNTVLAQVTMPYSSQAVEHRKGAGVQSHGPHLSGCQPPGEWLSLCPTSQTLSFQTYEQNEWIIHLTGKLLADDAEALSLLALNPFEGRAPPR